ncbi:MAG: sialidase [Gemmataceae bacterium]|nr:sialidase [Gemmataceae bacterium]
MNLLLQLLPSLLLAADPQASALLKKEFIYENAPFPQCHASTIVETPKGLVTAWFGGTAEKNPDVGIWVSRWEKGRWTKPVEAANGLQPNGTRHPTWNPVLFQPKEGPLFLFYKVGPSPTTWWGMVRTSSDHGQTWSEGKKLPDGFLGPIKNKPVQLANGTILSPTSTEANTRPGRWKIHFEASSDGGKTWSKVEPAADLDGHFIHAIQPSILDHGEGKLQALGRSRGGKIFETWSNDGGKTWSRLSYTALPNPSSGTDAVTLKDGRHLLIYNHTLFGRNPLNLAMSKDGKNWDAVLVLETEPGEYSYPAIIQTADGLVHITYTWKRQKVRHAVIDPAKLEGKAIVGGVWPK